MAMKTMELLEVIKAQVPSLLLFGLFPKILCSSEMLRLDYCSVIILAWRKSGGGCGWGVVSISKGNNMI